jgi:DNA invertase Pin-like site-specific DNA recombinase
MDDARKRKFDAVIVWRFDRFARSTKHLLLALEEFRSLGIQFVSYQENLDTATPLGQAIFTICPSIAETSLRQATGASASDRKSG